MYHAGQCDPRKCSSLRLKRHNLATIIHHTRELPKGAIILNPHSTTALSPADRDLMEKRGLIALDFSWKHTDEIVAYLTLRGASRCLPYLLAANPMYYGNPTKLSTVEALAAALFITNHQEEAKRLLAVFKWGPTFTTLNLELLKAYANSRDSTDVVNVQNQYLQQLQLERA